jgi:hypothetical protein
MSSGLRALTALTLAALLGACATPVAMIAPRDACGQWFEHLDAAVDAADVRDAQDVRLPGAPFMRVDRLAAATRDDLPWSRWIAHAAALDERARAAETANLPASAWPIDGTADAAAARTRSRACREQALLRLAQDDAAQRALRDRASVPDRYASAQRALGAYALLRWPFFAGVQAWQDEHADAVRRWSAAPPLRQRFAPPDDVPLAPVFEIERPADGGALPAHDRFGVPTWSSRDAAAPGVDSAQPVVYVRHGHTLYRSQWLRQQVYTVWFAERPPRHAVDLLAGRLDGVVVRLTLAPDGTPLLLDTIHACGCWHQFYPAPGLAPRGGAPAHEEWAFVPAGLPRLATGQRLAVRLAAGTHHVTGVAAVDAGAIADRYVLRDEDTLRSLPLPGGGARSLYGADGLVRGSERAERFVFWPMGIASAGAMRQWGHHATAFVGRRHFDDADLIERRFELPPWNEEGPAKPALVTH